MRTYFLAGMVKSPSASEVRSRWLTLNPQDLVLHRLTSKGTDLWDLTEVSVLELLVHIFIYMFMSISFFLSFFFYLLMLMGALLGSIPIANQQPHPPSLCWNTTKSQSTWHLSLVQKWSHFFWIAVLLTQTYLSPRNLTLNAISKVSKMN